METLLCKRWNVFKNCVEQIDGVYYGFDGSGYLYVNREFYSDSERAYYRAKEDGSLYIGEWYQERYNSYYYGEDGRKYVGFQTINGKQYYFEEHSGWLYKTNLLQMKMERSIIAI